MVVAKFIIGCIGHASGLVYCAYQHLGELHGKQSADHGQSGRQARVDCHTPACDARPQKIVSRTRSTFTSKQLHTPIDLEIATYGVSNDSWASASAYNTVHSKDLQVLQRITSRQFKSMGKRLESKGT
jgi:hypothetical protein